MLRKEDFAVIKMLEQCGVYQIFKIIIAAISVDLIGFNRLRLQIKPFWSNLYI